MFKLEGDKVTGLFWALGILAPKLSDREPCPFLNDHLFVHLVVFRITGFRHAQVYCYFPSPLTGANQRSVRVCSARSHS